MINQQIGHLCYFREAHLESLSSKACLEDAHLLWIIHDHNQRTQMTGREASGRWTSRT